MKLAYALTMILGATVAATAAEVRENELKIEVSQDITSASFTYTDMSFAITSGQPAGVPPVTATFIAADRELLISAFAGRSNSDGPAGTFRARTMDRVATQTGQAERSKRGDLSNQPKSLNFAFEGTLTLNTDKFTRVNLGQGRTGGDNNWWLGVPGAIGATIKSDGGNAFMCFRGESGTSYQVRMPGNSSSTIQVSIIGNASNCGPTS